ncbi:MSHA biogenesis protein MshJ [Glaciecola sp. MH2013]|uniref:MSHA biogenesis protein MshJ n=1 Tax=Glaciecola sp. MH2013 TaxID=2785524 RepID=UPI00189E8200|nr:MSHA biogenesis protein MshJ [Glaciecola sp. MH2013]MBF7073688.1 MSHA biogenesis protein MshJ [Glaciecola sp. MH2013]
MANLEKKFSQISLREQRLIFYTLPLALCFVMILSFIEPAIANAMKARVDMQNARIQLTTVSQNVELLELQLQVDVDDETRKQTAAINDEIVRVEKRFESELSKLVMPSVMPLVLESLLKDANKLAIVKMESIPPSNLFAKENAAETAEKQGIQENEQQAMPVLYQHGLRVVFEGTYADAQAFLAKSENMQWRLYWDSVSLTANEYPRSTVEIELFTLSRSEAYLNVN